MTKIEFLKRLHFPLEWEEWSLYPDKVFQQQLAEYQTGHEHSSEHTRFGAFCWWVEQERTSCQTDQLVKLTRLDPDEAMGDHARRLLATKDEDG